MKENSILNPVVSRFLVLSRPVSGSLFIWMEKAEMMIMNSIIDINRRPHDVVTTSQDR
jgi:hypothetical protein